jgi:hypothetical protein
MKLTILEEPTLQFKDGRHLDIRAGISKFGTFDKGGITVPIRIGVGVVGSGHTAGPVRTWIESIAGGVATEEKNLYLRPAFPGMNEKLFGTRLNISKETVRVISKSDLEKALADKADAMGRVVDLFIEHARDLAGRSGMHVIVIAPPPEVFALNRSAAKPDPDAELDESTEYSTQYRVNFHDLFKARALALSIPTQVIRPDTYGGPKTRVRGDGVGSLQDAATRAWNFNLALYYKAGGVPWRLVRQPSQLDTCYTGISFYKSPDGQRLLTSVAQVFDERGEGLVVQGGSARVDKDDRTAHLAAEDAQRLLQTALSSYKREHHNMPARLVIHKTSYFDAAEVEGFRAAASAERIDILDLISLRRSGIRVFPTGNNSAIRGTTLKLGERSGLIYLKGMVPYFGIYPGMYVPRGIEFNCDQGDTDPIEIAAELLALSKLNFNNTQFDSGDPITVRAARRVGDILKHVAPGSSVQSRFRFFT